MQNLRGSTALVNEVSLTALGAEVGSPCGRPLGICFWREALETAVVPGRRAGEWGLIKKWEVSTA